MQNIKQNYKAFLPYILVVLYVFTVFIFRQTALVFSIVFVLLTGVLVLEKFDYKKLLSIFSLLLVQPHVVFFIISFLQLDRFFDRYILCLCFLIFFILAYYLWFGKGFWSWIKKEQRIHLVFSLISYFFISIVFSNLAINCYNVSGAEKGVTHQEIALCSFFNLYTPGVIISGTFSGFYAMGTLMVMGTSLVVPIIWLSQFLFYLENSEKLQ